MICLAGENMYDMGACHLFFGCVPDESFRRVWATKKPPRHRPSSDSLAARLASRIVPLKPRGSASPPFDGFALSSVPTQYNYKSTSSILASCACLSCHIMGRSNAVLRHDIYASYDDNFASKTNRRVIPACRIYERAHQSVPRLLRWPALDPTI